MGMAASDRTTENPDEERKGETKSSRPSAIHYRQLFLEKVCVFRDEVFPLSWQFIFHKYRINGTFRLTKTAVDAFIRVDEELVFSLVDTVNWTNSYAGFVFDADAGLSNHIGHNSSILQIIIGALY
jgi:hypothetical protein